MKKQLTFHVDTMVIVEYDTEKTNAVDSIATTIKGLAFSPNYHTIEEGTQLVKFFTYTPRISRSERKTHNIH